MAHRVRASIHTSLITWFVFLEPGEEENGWQVVLWHPHEPWTPATHTSLPPPHKPPHKHEYTHTRTHIHIMHMSSTCIDTYMYTYTCIHTHIDTHAHTLWHSWAYQQSSLSPTLLSRNRELLKNLSSREFDSICLSVGCVSKSLSHFLLGFLWPAWGPLTWGLQKRSLYLSSLFIPLCPPPVGKQGVVVMILSNKDVLSVWTHRTYMIVSYVN